MNDASPAEQNSTPGGHVPGVLTRRRLTFGTLTAMAATALAACGGAAPAAAPAPSPTAAANRPAAPTAPAAAPATSAATAPAAAAPAGALRFQVLPDQSKAIFRVREQLAGVQAPSDAVGTTNAVSGQLALQPDGTVVSNASKISVDMTSLKTDQSLRDNFIKNTTLQTRQFPSAEFVPTKTEGLPNPLPTSGEHTFKLTGMMTIHGVQKELTWDVTCTRNPNGLNGTATTSFKFGDFGMTPPRAPAVLSVVDEIRLEVQLATSLVA